MDRAQKIRKERQEFFKDRQEFLKSVRNPEALVLYHSVLDLFEYVKFYPNYNHITIYSSRGYAHLVARETLYRQTTVAFSKVTLKDLIDLFKAEEGYDAYWSNQKGEKDNNGNCVTVVMED